MAFELFHIAQWKAQYPVCATCCDGTDGAGRRDRNHSAIADGDDQAAARCASEKRQPRSCLARRLRDLPTRPSGSPGSTRSLHGPGGGLLLGDGGRAVWLRYAELHCDPCSRSPGYACDLPPDSWCTNEWALRCSALPAGSRPRRDGRQLKWPGNCHGREHSRRWMPHYIRCGALRPTWRRRFVSSGGDGASWQYASYWHMPTPVPSQRWRAKHDWS